MREKEAYRDNLERIKEMYPNKELLSISDVCKYAGRDYKTVIKRYPFKDKFISVATLARFDS